VEVSVQEAVMKVRSVKPPVYRITGARRSLSEDIRYRERRYIISMGFRTVCFVLALAIHGPMRFVLIVAALVVPYFAVVFANGGREPAPAPPSTTLTERQHALEPEKRPISHSSGTHVHMHSCNTRYRAPHPPSER
jgi:hypothetical protein